MRCQVLLVRVVVWGIISIGSIHGVVAQTEFQSFDSEASASADGWLANDEAQNPDREIDLGYWSTNHAGGAAAGEGGGLLHRSFGLPIGFYADTTIGELTLDVPFMASGKVALQNIDFDGHAYLGFFNAQTLLDDPLDFGAEIAFCIAEPGGGVAPNFRWGHLFTDDELTVNHSNGEFLEGIPDGEAVDFELAYDPQDGDGTITFVIGDEPEVVFPLDSLQREAGATLNAFGVFTSTHGGSGRPDAMEIFLDDLTYTSSQGGGGIRLQAGDADQDLDFDQLDLVQVQIAAKYLTGQAATWGDGDWDGAPGGESGSPPAGNGFFDQLDIIGALAAGFYLTGPYGAIGTGGAPGDGQTSVAYDQRTGELSVDPPAGMELTSINITSAGARFIGERPTALDGAFDNFAADNLFKATFGGSFGAITFGQVLPAGLTEDQLSADLTIVGSLAGGGDLGPVDLVDFFIPEPSTVVLLGLGLIAYVARRGRGR